MPAKSGCQVALNPDLLAGGVDDAVIGGLLPRAGVEGDSGSLLTATGLADVAKASSD